MQPYLLATHFRRAGLGPLLTHARLVYLLAGDAQGATLEDLLARLRDLGLPPPDAERVAACLLHLALLELAGDLMPTPA